MDNREIKDRAGRLALLLPSDRPDLFLQLLASFDVTHAGNADIILRTQASCSTSPDYDSIDHPFVIRDIGLNDGDYGQWPDAGYCFAMQELWVLYPGYAAYSMCEDDFTFTEDAWDKKILDGFSQFPNRVGQLQWQVTGRPAIAIAVSDTWANALGYFQPPLKEAGYEALSLLGRDGRSAFGPTLHHNLGNSRWGHRSPLWTPDLADMANWCATGMLDRDLAKLAAAASEE